MMLSIGVKIYQIQYLMSAFSHSDAVKAFEHYSLLLSRGQHVEEISLWMLELMKSTDVCLPTLLTVLQSSTDPTSVSSFLAGKVMYDFLLCSCDSSTIIENYSNIFQILLKHLHDHVAVSYSPSYKQIVRSVAAITALTAEMGVLSPDKFELHMRIVNALSELSQQSTGELL